MRIAKSTGVGVLTIIAGLEEAARVVVMAGLTLFIFLKVLASEVAGETEATVRHRYGDDAASLAKTSLQVRFLLFYFFNIIQSVGNITHVYTTTNRLKYKSIRTVIIMPDS